MHPWQKRWRQGETTLTFFKVPQQMAHRVSARTDPCLTVILAEISRCVGGSNCGLRWVKNASTTGSRADECLHRFVFVAPRSSQNRSLFR